MSRSLSTLRLLMRTSSASRHVLWPCPCERCIWLWDVVRVLFWQWKFRHRVRRLVHRSWRSVGCDQVIVGFLCRKREREKERQGVEWVHSMHYNTRQYCTTQHVDTGNCKREILLRLWPGGRDNIIIKIQLKFDRAAGTAFITSTLPMRQKGPHNIPRPQGLRRGITNRKQSKAMCNVFIVEDKHWCFRTTLWSTPILQ
jgi:hypothetical protein